MEQLTGFIISTTILLIALHLGLSFLGYKNAVPGAIKKIIRLFFRALWWPFRVTGQEIKKSLQKSRQKGRQNGT